MKKLSRKALSVRALAAWATRRKNARRAKRSAK